MNKLDKAIVKVAAGYVGLVALCYVAENGVHMARAPVVGAYSQKHLVWKAKIKKGLKDGTIVEENGKYYEKFTVEDGPNYRKNKKEDGKKRRGPIVG